MSTERSSSKKETPAKDAGKETYEGLHQSTQTFPGVGLLEAVQGDVVLRGRHGERDHLYPLHRAIARFEEMRKYIHRLALYGVRGWDTLMDINRELKCRIMEAIAQRRKLNRDIPKIALEFEALFEDNKIPDMKIPGKAEGK